MQSGSRVALLPSFQRKEERLTGIPFSSGAFSAVLFFRSSGSPFRSVNIITAKRLHSTGITPLRSSYAPLRLPLPQTARVMVFPQPVRNANLRRSVVEGLSRIPQLFIRYALSPVTPTDLTCACVYFFHVSDRLHHIRKDSRRHILVTRPD